MTYKMIIHLTNDRALCGGGLDENQMLLIRKQLKNSIRYNRPWSDGHGTLVNPQHIIYIDFNRED